MTTLDTHAESVIEMTLGAAAGYGKSSPIRRILTAIEHEHHPALERAVELALQLGAQVGIVYVVEPLPEVSAEIAFDMAPVMERSAATGRTMLAELVKELPAGVVAFTAVREGKPAEEIVSAAEECKADLIVMGSHRRGAIARLILGSTSQAVLRQARCPVMVVAEPGV